VGRGGGGGHGTGKPPARGPSAWIAGGGIGYGRAREGCPRQGRRTYDGSRCRCFRSTSAQQQANPAFSRVLSAPPVRSSKRNLVFAHL
jgi:hypothetical protein